MKTIGAVGIKTSGRKRAVSDAEAKVSRKLQKNQEVDLGVPDEIEQVQDDPGQVFRFLELPGELRNRIYEYAAAWTHRCFPPTWPKNKPLQRIRGQTIKIENPYPANKPIPHIGLTQVCSVVRAEFRPLWLSCHQFPPHALEGYLKTFFPLPTPSTDRERFDKYFEPNGTLRLYLSQHCLSNVDILRLLKHKARFPSYTIQLTTGGGRGDAIDVGTQRALEAFIHNDNLTWNKWIKGNVVTQVRFMSKATSVQGTILASPVRVIVKEKYAPEWMRPSLNVVIPKGYVDSLGLGMMTDDGWMVTFGVNYS